MTEEEWLAATSPGTVLEAVRRHARFRPGVLGRKGRRAACEIMRLVVPALGNPSWLEPIELTEQFIDGHATMADIEAAINAADEVDLTPTQTTKQALRFLTKPDPFAVAYGASPTAARFLDLRSGFRRPDYDAYGNDLQLRAEAVAILRDIFGNPFRPTAFDPEWRTSTAVALAKQMYESRDFGAMPILADALQDAGCDSDDVLNHCRDANGVHVRGCWVVDWVLGKA